MSLRPYQSGAVTKAVDFLRKSIEPIVIDAATGCHEASHPILMHDGSIKLVEKVVVGDLVMGPDSKPRRVLKLHRGFERMFNVFPVKGEPFRVNASHIFSVYCTPKKKGQSHRIEEVTAWQLYDGSDSFRHTRKLQRCAVDFPESEQEVPAYVVGALLGDGHLNSPTPSFCTMDTEVHDEISAWAESIGCFVTSYQKKGSKAWNANIVDQSANRSSENRARRALKDIGIYDRLSPAKSVPAAYKVASRKQRLELLAGLIDTDGYLSRSGYDWISASDALADDMVYLCRSVGLAAYKTECQKSCQNDFTRTYYRISISGDCSIVPCRVPRRIAPKRWQMKRCDVTGMKLHPSESIEPYYGFELDGDHLYLDGYFVRHHNSGKSHMIARVAEIIHGMTGKRVLVLAPSAELVEQDRAKYLLTGNPAGLFSASAGGKNLRWPVVFGSPKTVLNSIHAFQRQGSEGYALVVVDEAHGLTPTLLSIIDAMRSANPNLRVLGFTATPYRMGQGYIFHLWPDGRANTEDVARDPYFTQCVARITPRELIDQGYLTPPVIGSTNAEGYDTSKMRLNSMGQFRAADVDQAYHGHGRKTAAIVGDVVNQAQERRGVLFFAATVQHAEEIMASLPPAISAIVTGTTKRRERAAILRRFLAQEIKYLVNVSVLTTGFDAPHVDVIAMLRKTESVGLLQQIVGRGLRLYPGKTDCLVLDYTENIETHCPDGDLFDPKIRAKAPSENPKIEVRCPSCDTVQEFTMNGEYADFKHDAWGYVLDLDGNRIETEYGPIPAHFGRRCNGMERSGERGEYERCSYRWTSKECEACGGDNDIAARYCAHCKAEMVDPNEKLIANFREYKRDPTQPQTDRVLSMDATPSVSVRGNKMLRVVWKTPYRQFTTWLLPEAKYPKGMREWRKFCEATDDGDAPPDTITYRKDPNTGFFVVMAYNRREDREPTSAQGAMQYAAQ